MTFNGWKEVVLEEVSYYGDEKIPSAEVTLDNYISTENMLPNKSGVGMASGLPTTKSVRRYKKGDILLSNIRPYFKKIWFATKNGGCSNDVLVIKNKDEKELDKKYLYYTLLQDNFFDYVTATSKGTKMPRGDKSAIMNYGIMLPPLNEQKAIANILSTLDEKIETNNQINEKLEEMAQALFKHWFVDFEFPNENGKPYKSSGGEMVESELGMIPIGWKIESVGDITSVNIGKTPPRKEKQWFSQDMRDIRWISIKDLGNSNVFINHSTEYLTTEAVEKFNIKKVPDNTVVLSFKLTVGRIAITIGEMATNEAIAHFNIVDKDVINPYYLYLYLKDFNFQSLGSTSSIATAINSKLVRTIPVLIPDRKQMEKFRNFIAPLFKEIRSNVLENEKLYEIRELLCPKLMSGEIRVPLDNETLIEQS
ncbi:restriction endonuclease subunit S [Weizmannia sp. FSL W8-0401]|uniref:restriction endonuclease subunit S n=1 Tax=Weizmannia sp. FSL W8-0401 TaxID=2954554 RepID=UPI0030FA3258